jgi:predicted transcriptional regulator
MKELAEVLNIGRASLYRAFAVLTEAGLISRDKDIVNILEIEKLRSHSL